MRKEVDFDMVTLLQDEVFVQQVTNSIDNENLLANLDSKYPGQPEALANAIDFIRVAVSEKKRMSASEVESSWTTINNHLGKVKTRKGSRFTPYYFLKIAAVLVLILACSIFIVRKYSRDGLDDFAAIKTVVGDQAMIILSDGSQHHLSKKDSLIEYSSNGGEVIVKNSQQEEKLENNTTAKSSVINQIVVPYGHRHSVLLSDGTRVQLNSGSRLVFPATFTDKTREVFLKGEGYFEVAKNAARPFIVRTDHLDVRVLGTSFNVSAYEDEQNVSTVLVEGSVEVSQKDKLFGSSSRKIVPGQGCFYSSVSNSFEIKSVEIYDYTCWKDGLLLFKDKSLGDISGRLAKYYNKNILIETTQLSKTLISGKLVLSDNIDEVMQYLATTLEARYEKKLDGSFLITN